MKKWWINREEGRKVMKNDSFFDSLFLSQDETWSLEWAVMWISTLFSFLSFCSSIARCESLLFSFFHYLHCITFLVLSTKLLLLAKLLKFQTFRVTISPPVREAWFKSSRGWNMKTRKHLLNEKSFSGRQSNVFEDRERMRERMREREREKMRERGKQEAS